MTVADAINLSETRELAQIDLSSGERRVLVCGEPPLDGVASGSVVCGPTGRRRKAESYVDLQVPGLDVDDRALRPLRIGFIVGDDTDPVLLTALLLGPDPMPIDLAAFVARRCMDAMHEASMKSKRSDLADDVDYMAIWILRRRAEQIEAAVVDALAATLCRTATLRRSDVTPLA